MQYKKGVKYSQTNVETRAAATAMQTAWKATHPDKTKDNTVDGTRVFLREQRWPFIQVYMGITNRTWYVKQKRTQN